MQIAFLIPLVSGYLLDLILGDPEKIPHPIVLFGRIITIADKLFNRGRFVFIKGAVTSGCLILGVYFFFLFCERATLTVNTWINIIFNTVFVYYCIANKNLIDEGRNVFNVLRRKGIIEARKALSRIVGRDTTELSENKIKIAVFETMSENLSDGVVAPLFYYLIGGVPAMMAYKMVNTLDSMIGYKNERYFWFGKTAARLDDLANFLPARITALLITVSEFSIRGVKYIFRYGRAHTSLNSGYPEAALAGVIDAQFGGSNYYNGILVSKPHIGIYEREIKDEEFKRIAFINQKVTFLFILILTGIKLL